MTNSENFSDKAKSWVNYKISKLKELKDRKPTGDRAEPEIIERLLTQKKRSIHPIPQASLEGLRNEIELSIAESRPIRLITGLGCYKPASLPSPTTANWAEFIHLAYISEIAIQISLVHKPGVEVIYNLGDIDMNLLADVTDESVDKYFQTFNKLADKFRNWVPSNVRFHLSKLSDRVSKEEFRNATEVEIARLRPIWNKTRHSSIKIDEVCERTKRNNANKILSEDEVFEKALRSEAMLIVDVRHLFEQKAINLIYRKITDAMIHGQHGKTIFPFRSCSGSLVQFWVGEGGLVWNGKKIYPVIFGQNSIQKASVLTTIDWHEFWECGPNFNRITIYTPAQ